MTKYYLSIIVFCFSVLIQPVFGSSVTEDYCAFSGSRDSFPEHFSNYPFLKKDANHIQSVEGLDYFFDQLAALESREKKKVTIVHIGDSHVQADFWTGRLRRLFQKRFGSAGRGFVFPFALAESHNPLDIKTNSNTTWEYHRSVFKKGPPMGLGGASIATTKPDFFIDLTVKDSLATDKFNKITLFNQKGPSTFDFILGKGDVTKADLKKPPVKRRYHRVRSGETLSHLARRYGCSVSSLKRWNGLRSSRINIGQRLAVSRPVYVKSKTPDFTQFAYLANDEYPDSVYAATLFLDKPANQLIVKAKQRLETQKEMIFYGVSLENTEQPGVLYHAIGVNGATFYHYNKAALFFDQIGELSPDLVIVSLGTNEAASSRFNADSFAEEVEAFSIQIRQKFPTASILFTTNPAVIKKGKVNSPSNEKARAVLMDVSKKHGYAVWDLQELMGSMKPWQKEGLGRPDGIHFSRKGYEVQAELLFDSIMESYNAGH